MKNNRGLSLVDRIASGVANVVGWSLFIGVIIAAGSWFFVSLTAWEFLLIAAFWPVIALLAVVAVFVM